jgi:nucleoside 2-deoxyribosyltransferase
MNQRIEELAQQAGFKVNWHNADVQAIKMARLEKFAELIVRECLNNIENCDGDIDFAIWKTKKEYGVEE